MNTKRFIITIVTLLLMTTSSTSQVLPRIPNGVWEGTFNVKTNSWLIGHVGSNIASVWDNLNSVLLKNDISSSKWLWIDVQQGFHVPGYRMHDANGNVMELGSEKWWKNFFWNWNYDFEVAPSYEIGWTPKNAAWLSLIAGAGYEYKQLYFQDSFLEGHHRTHSVIPVAALRIKVLDIYKVLDIDDDEFPIYIEVGASYVYNFKYTNPQDYSLEALNNGIRGRFRLNTPVISIAYEHDFYNYFNYGFSPDGGVTHPLDGIKNNFGSMCIQVSYNKLSALFDSF